MASLHPSVALLTILATILCLATSPAIGGCPFASSFEEKPVQRYTAPEPVQDVDTGKAIPKTWNTDFCRRKCLRKQCRKIMRYNKGSMVPDLLQALFHDHQPCALDGSLRFELNRRENIGLKGVAEKVWSAAHMCGCSVADGHALCAAMAVRRSGGPRIAMRWGHKDANIANPPNNMPPGGFPPSVSGPAVLRRILHQYDDKNIVLLSSAHNIGHVHIRNKKGKVVKELPFTTNESRFTNEYFKNLRQIYLTGKKPKGTFQLPSDLALIEDKYFRKYVMMYAKNQRLYFRDFRGMMDLMIGDFRTCFRGGQSSDVSWESGIPEAASQVSNDRPSQ